MKITIEHANYLKMDAWTVYLTCETKHIFYALVNRMEQELKLNAITCLEFPWKNKNVYGDTFAVNKSFMSKKEFLKTIRSIIKNHKVETYEQLQR